MKVGRRRKVASRQHPPVDRNLVSLETGEFKVEVDIPPIAKDLAKILTERYQGSEKHWTEGEENVPWGMLAELAFGSYLYQYEIPSVYNNPIFQRKEDKRSYDYRVPRIGSIEVKGVPPGDKKKNLLVKVSEWKGSDYVVAFKFENEKPTRLMGWLTREEVENLPKQDFGHGEAYYRPLNELRPLKDFHELLLRAK